jgi:hypothetical protein
MKKIIITEIRVTGVQKTIKSCLNADRKDPEGERMKIT